MNDEIKNIFQELITLNDLLNKTTSNQNDSFYTCNESGRVSEGNNEEQEGVP